MTVVDSDSCSLIVVVTYFGFRLWSAASCCIVFECVSCPSATFCRSSGTSIRQPLSNCTVNLYVQQRARIFQVFGRLRKRRNQVEKTPSHQLPIILGTLLKYLHLFPGPTCIASLPYPFVANQHLYRLITFTLQLFLALARCLCH